MIPSLTRWFGVTGSDSERNFQGEKAITDEIVEKVLQLQAKSAAQDHRPLARGTHAKGVTVRAQFEVLDVKGRGGALAARLAQGMFAKPGIYPAIVRFANSDPRVNSDFKPDVRSLSFSVDLNGDRRQDFSLQNARILPINDAPAFLAIMKLLTASSPPAGLLSLPFKDKLRVLRTLSAGSKFIRTIKSIRISNYATGAMCRFVTDLTRSCETFSHPGPAQSWHIPCKGITRRACRTN